MTDLSDPKVLEDMVVGFFPTISNVFSAAKRTGFDFEFVEVSNIIGYELLAVADDYVVARELEEPGVFGTREDPFFLPFGSSVGYSFRAKRD